MASARQLARGRRQIELIENWEAWRVKVPTLTFPPNCQVKIIPPYLGAMVRFVVHRGDKSVSVYLDVFDRLGYMGSPYWEIYPYKEDTVRFAMEDVDEMMVKVDEELNRNALKLLIDGSQRDDG